MCRYDSYEGVSVGDYVKCTAAGDPDYSGTVIQIWSDTEISPIYYIVSESPYHYCPRIQRKDIYWIGL